MLKSVNGSPPKLARWLLKRFLRDDLAEEVEGDLEEKFLEVAKHKSGFRAKLNYWYQVFHYLRPFAIRKKRTTIIYYDMLQNYFKISWRSLLKQKMYSTIKVGGLAIGVAACFLITLFVIDELSYDQHHENGERLYRVVGVLEGEETTRDVDLPPPAASAFETDFIEVEMAGRINPSPLFGAGANELRRADRVENTHEEGFTFFDQKLLEMLRPKMISGTIEDALAKPYTIVITKRKAEKYFPNEDAVGKQMIINDNKNQPYTIGGVIEDFPANTVFQYDFLLTLTNIEFWEGEQTWWGASNYPTFLLLKPGVDIEALEKKMTKGIIEKYLMPMAVESGEPNAIEIFKRAHLELQPVRDIHLGADVRDGLPHGDIRFIWLFSAVAGFIVLIASINFINLSTARSSNRAKEVGLRKTVGSTRGHLINQFLSESILFSFLAFIVGILLAGLVLPYFNILADKNISFPWDAGWLVPMLVAGILLVGLISGIYPAFYLSSFNPVNVLKGKVSRGSKSSSARSVLVVFQFTISIVLIIGTAVIYRQMDFILNKKIGYNKDQVVLLEGAGTLGDKAPEFKNELLKLAHVQYVSICDYLPIRGTKRNGNTFHKEGMEKIEKGIIGQRWTVDADYIKTMGIHIVEGRDFNKDLRSDSSAVIINQAMAKQLNLTNPIGARIQNWAVYTVIGVVEDFHYESMKENIQPLLMVLGNSPTLISVKVNTTDMRSAVESISAVWDKFSLNQPVRFNFLDDRYAMMYADVQRMGNIFTTFAVLAIIVACLGLFALSAFMVEQRSKEISIRLVLGASLNNVFRLLTQNFVLLVLISFALATPMAWYLMNKWLQDFAYKTNITWDIFVVSGVCALLVALSTVSYQAIRAALANPVTNLRSE